MIFAKWFPHWHWWEETAHNKFMICIERRCILCGKYQWHGIGHHKPGDMFSKYFVDGEHPKKDQWKS